MWIVKNRKIFFGISIVLVIASITLMSVFGLKFGTDFTGGSILEVSYLENRPELEDMNSALSEVPDLGSFSLRPSGEDGFVLRAKELSLEEKQVVLSVFSNQGEKQITENRFNTVGPVVGESLKRKSYTAITVVLLGIVLFVTFAFRKVSKPVSSWKYGLATIIALAHDILVPTGAYVLFGQFTSAEIDLLFVTALLAILGYSVHDTIVVFDRVRENLNHNQEYNQKEDFEITVGKSLKETMARSINTSLTLVLSLVALYLLGSEATKNFVFILLFGVIAGTYSSIFLASPLLVSLVGKKSK